MKPRRAICDTGEINRAQAFAQLRLMLSAMRPERLAAVTVDELAAINKTPRSEIERALGEARQGRMGV